MSHRRLLVSSLLATSVLLAVPLTPRPAAAAPPAIKHVWVVVLENKSYDETFGPTSPAPYLAKTLPSLGQHLTQYYGIGHVSLDNYIAMLSGQGPNATTQSDCLFYADALPGVIATDGQAVGQGCVYPAAVKTLADQLSAKGLTWRGYMQDMGNTPSREAATCGHPALNSQDGTQTATAADSYASRHDPFVYFHSIIDSPACAANVVSLTALPADLAAGAQAPNFSFISPSLCEDGHDAPCADGRPGGLLSINAFLTTWVPRILGSSAYADGGMLIVTFDEAEPAGTAADATACCGETAGPNSPLPGISGPGGGRVGAVVVSRFTQPGSVNATPYNHYTLLRSIEDIFGLAHLGYANVDGLVAFGPDVYNASSPTPPAQAGQEGAIAGSARNGTASSTLPPTGAAADGRGALAALALVIALVSARLARSFRQHRGAKEPEAD